VKEKKIGDLEEEIDAMGQESEIKASKWVKEKGKEWDKEAEVEKGKALDVLEGKTRYKFADYKRFLGEELMRRGWEEFYPKDWMFHSTITDKGIVYYLRSPDKRMFVRAFAPVNIPEYDFVAIEKILESAWECINNWEEEKSNPKSSIILPNGDTKRLQNPDN